MAEWNNSKILICDMNNHEGSLMKDLLLNYEFKNITFEHDITELKRQVYHIRPDVIISGNHLWNDETGIRFIMEYQFAKDIPLIIWSENFNDEILRLVLKNKNLHFIKKTNSENELIDTLRNFSLHYDSDSI